MKTQNKKNIFLYDVPNMSLDIPEWDAIFFFSGNIQTVSANKL